MKEMYETDESFKQYVDRCCKKHECDVETSFTFSWVKNAYEYYKKTEKIEKPESSNMKVGCGGAQ